MNTKVVIFLIDYYMYPLVRVKTVKYRSYQCGLASLSSVIETFRDSLNIESHLFLTGGPANESHTSLFQHVHPSVDNTLHDFSGYLAAAKFAHQNFAGSCILPVFCNSSCPPRYLQILLDCIHTLSSTGSDLSDKVIAPAFAYLFRYRISCQYRPHFQSYCFTVGEGCIPYMIHFIQGHCGETYHEKKDYISRLELGLSSFFMQDNRFKVFRATGLGLKKPAFWIAVSDNPFSVLDPRLAPISLDMSVR
jgi:hypothetical protein